MALQQIANTDISSTGTFALGSVSSSALTSGRVTYATTGGLLTDSSSLTYNGTILTSAAFSGALNGTVGATTPSTVVATSVTNSGLTSGRITYASTGGLLVDSSSLVFSGTVLTVGVTGLSANTDGTTGKLVLRKPNEATGNPQITRMLDFAPYYPGYDEAVVKASISAGVDTGTQNGQLGFMVATGGVLYEKMRILADGSVGIGTSSPTNLLHLSSSGSTGQTITSVGTNVYSSISFFNTTTGYGYDIGFGGSASVAPNSFYIYGGSSAGVKLVVNPSGFVGIGVSNPAVQLEIGGTNPTINIGATNSASGGALSYNTAGNYLSINAVTQGVGYRNIIIANDGGNVGIGTSSPAGKFDITGASNGTVNSYLRAHGGTSARANLLIDMYTTTAGAAGALTFQRAHTNTLGGTTDVSSGDYLGYINFYGTSRGNGSYNSGGSIQVVVNGAASTYVPADMYIYTNSGSTDRSVSPQLTIHNNGNVGIATISPNQLLTLGSSDGTQALSFVTSAYLGDDALIGNIEFSTHGADTSYGNLANIKAYKTGTNTNSGDLSFWTKASGSSAQRMRITKDGVMYLGASLGNNFSFAYGGSVDISGSGTGLAGTATNLTLGAWNGPIIFQAGNSANALQERMRIDASGRLLIGTTSNIAASGGAYFQLSATKANWLSMIEDTGTSGNLFCQYLRFGGSTPNDATSMFFYCGDAAGQKMSVKANGGIYNYSANDSNLSDEREKKNIQLAPNYLDKICQIPVKTFLYNDQTDTDLNLGVIAQDVEAICPELIMESNWANKDEEPRIRKSIYQTDLQYALMKCIQEQQALIESMAAKLKDAGVAGF
jgi:hypothetical protein